MREKIPTTLLTPSTTTSYIALVLMMVTWHPNKTCVVLAVPEDTVFILTIPANTGM